MNWFRQWAACAALFGNSKQKNTNNNCHENDDGHEGNENARKQQPAHSSLNYFPELLSYADLKAIAEVMCGMRIILWQEIRFSSHFSSFLFFPVSTRSFARALDSIWKWFRFTPHELGWKKLCSSYRSFCFVHDFMENSKQRICYWANFSVL